jgi:hypothetical protein
MGNPVSSILAFGTHIVECTGGSEVQEKPSRRENAPSGKFFVSGVGCFVLPGSPRFRNSIRIYSSPIDPKGIISEQISEMDMDITLLTDLNVHLDLYQQYC